MVERTYTRVEPWGPQQNPLAYGIGTAWNMFRGKEGMPEYFPGSTVVGLSPYSQQAIDMRAQRGLQGSPAEAAMGNYLLGTLGQQNVNLNPAISQLGATASGAFLGANPYLDAQFGAMTRGLGDQFDRAFANANATFGAGGRTGSGAHQQMLRDMSSDYATRLGDVAANLYGGNYQQERARQLQATGQLGNLYSQIGSQQQGAANMVPALSALQYGNLDQLAQAGAGLDQQARAELQDQINRHQFQQSAPWDYLNRFMGVVGQPYGSATSAPSQSPNAAMTALGGAGTGAAVGSMFGPIGMGIGGLIGGVGGLLGGLL